MTGARVASVASEPFETTDPLPVRHGGVVGLDLDPRLVEVVLDHVVAEGGAGDLRLFEQPSGLPQRGGQVVDADE